MFQDAIEALAPRVQACAADDCVLLLWTTTQKLAEAVAIIAAWGFEIKSGAVWVKPSIGMGCWFRARHELLILGTRGHPSTLLEPQRPDSVIVATRAAHSQKPDETYLLIEAMFSNVPKVELFARGPARPGWATWGNE
jgi:N6-adenosine-specific RNA methylase IME4